MIREALFVLFLAVAPAAVVTSTAPEPTYCDGWEKGYVAGWCFERPMCLPPMPPMCPLPEFMLDTYQDGYNRGFVRGREDRDEQ